MGKPKLFKFADLNNMPNVFQKDTGMKGKWHAGFFGNDAPITLELACGKGDYTLGLAERFPERNFIGMDIKGNRIWSAARKGRLAGLENVAFVRGQIDHLTDYFASGEVDEIWITFPDPFLKPSRWKKRLTAPRFLELYRHVLRPGGRIHLKTDNDVLYAFTLQVLERGGHKILHQYNDIYAAGVEALTYGIQTYYEQMHLRNGLTIKYVCFELGDKTATGEEDQVFSSTSSNSSNPA